jgi:hypothetical protein
MSSKKTPEPTAPDMRFWLTHEERAELEAKHFEEFSLLWPLGAQISERLLCPLLTTLIVESNVATRGLLEQFVLQLLDLPPRSDELEDVIRGVAARFVWDRYLPILEKMPKGRDYVQKHGRQMPTAHRISTLRIDSKRSPEPDGWRVLHDALGLTPEERERGSYGAISGFLSDIRDFCTYMYGGTVSVQLVVRPLITQYSPTGAVDGRDFHLAHSCIGAIFREIKATFPEHYNPSTRTS